MGVAQHKLAFGSPKKSSVLQRFFAYTDDSLVRSIQIRITSGEKLLALLRFFRLFTAAGVEAGYCGSAVSGIQASVPGAPALLLLLFRKLATIACVSGL